MNQGGFCSYWLNAEILELLGKRLAYVRRAGEIKGPVKPANDTARVEEQLKNIRALSLKYDLPTEISEKIFKVIMTESINYQQKYKDEYFKIK